MNDICSKLAKEAEYSEKVNLILEANQILAKYPELFTEQKLEIKAESSDFTSKIREEIALILSELGETASNKEQFAKIGEVVDKFVFLYKLSLDDSVKSDISHSIIALFSINTAEMEPKEAVDALNKSIFMTYKLVSAIFCSFLYKFSDSLPLFLSFSADLVEEMAKALSLALIRPQSV